MTDMADSGMTCANNDHITPPPTLKLPRKQRGVKTGGEGGGVKRQGEVDR